MKKVSLKHLAVKSFVINQQAVKGGAKEIDSQNNSYMDCTYHCTTGPAIQ